MTDHIATDVLVVGLGPAGSQAAAVAARTGCSVIAIDRKKQAGTPVQCAEFIPAMLSQELNDLDDVTQQRISSMATFIETENADIKHDFPGRIIDRCAFDAALVKAAEKAGADCQFGVQLEKIIPKNKAVLSDGKTIKAKVIIGADGPRSRVGRTIGQFNLELVETRQITVPLLMPHDATDIFLSASIPGGYGWLFPKNDIANLGIGAAPWAKKNLKPLLEKLHDELVGDGRVSTKIIAHTGGAIPVGGMLTVFSWFCETPVLLAGDAAGLTNPVTGAGITSAVVSGDLAGQAAADWLHGNETAFKDYTEELRDLFGTALDRALRRRNEILEQYVGEKNPSPAALRRSWIAYPEYWAA